VPQSASKKFKDVLMNGQSAIQNGASMFIQAAAKKLDDNVTSVMSLRSKTTAIPTALPRFNPAVKKITMVAAPQESKRLVTEQNTAERGAPTPLKAPASSRKTPLKKDVALMEEKTLGASSTCNNLIKRLKKAISNSPSPEVIRAQFDGGFSINEERVTTIFTHLKVKNKWDYKEKAKKQDAVIKELRDCLVTTFGEIKSVREQCLMHENHINNLIRDSYEEFLEISQSLNTLHASNLKSQQDLIKAQEELRNTSSTMMKFKTDQSPLRNRNKEFEARIIELQTQLVIEQTESDQLKAEHEKLKIDFAELKEKSESAASTMKEDFEQRIEQSVAGYRDEVSILRAELKNRQGDADRYSGEKADLDRRKAELDAEVLRATSRVREVESANARYEKEIDRHTAELDRLREQLTLKDADLRSTINSLQDIQKQGSEEKCGIRNELSMAQARVQALEEERLSITAQLASKKEETCSQARELAQLRESVAQLEATLSIKEGEARGVKDIVLQLEVEKELRQRCEVREETERRERIAATAQLMATQSECSSRIREVEEKKEAAIAILQNTNEEITRQREQATEEARRESGRAAGLEMEVQQLHKELEKGSVNHEAVEELSRVKGELVVLNRKISEAENSKLQQVDEKDRLLAEEKEKLRVSEAMRRKLHNLVQELRGNVRVFARVRPFLQNDGVDLTHPPQPTIDAKMELNTVRIVRPANGPDERTEDHMFTFDKVFNASCSQESLFNEVSEFVQSALDGYNVCLFSYGQTGSGKTHTMQGSGTGAMRGVIPRAMEQVGVYKTQLEAKGWEYQMEVSFVEIYNETIRDLLRSGSGEDCKHEIKHGANGTSITDVTMRNVDPNDVEQIEGIMEQAARHRSVGKTEMNERSSRSHSIFCLHLKATNAAQGVVLKGTLSLVDLAGSERLDRSGATGEQLKETVAINKSLSALADVFVAIGNKQAHIPFRNSKLTYLLQPALSGDGKTLMMVNLSPTIESFQESLCSLRLAKQINQCELGKPKKQVKDVSSSAAQSSSSGASSKNSSSETAPSSSKASSAEPSATPSKVMPKTPSRPGVTKQMSASLSAANALAAASASATPQLMTASLGGRRAAPGTATSTASTASKRVKK